MKILKIQQEIKAPALRRKYFYMMQSYIFRLRDITSAYFSVQTWDPRQVICLLAWWSFR